jgi:O-antigen/teichoic acid export membrane protein
MVGFKNKIYIFCPTFFEKITVSLPSRILTLLKSHSVAVEGIIAQGFYKIFQLTLGLVTTYYIAHSLSKDNYGHYNYILTVIGLLSFFSLPFVNNAVSQSVARGFLGTYKASILTTFFSSCGGGLILLLLSAYYHLNHDALLARAFLIAAIVFPFLYGLTTWKSLYLGEQKYKKIIKLAGVNNVISSSLLIAIAIFFPNNVLFILLCFLAIPALQNVAQTTLLYFKQKNTYDTEEGSIKYGIKASFYSIISLIATNIDSILLFHFLSPTALANFIAAQKLPEVIKSSIQDIGQILLPIFSKKSHMTKNLSWFFNIFGIAISIGILILTFTIYPYIFILIFGEQYRDALIYGQALMCSIAISNAAPLKVWFINSKLDAKSNRDTTLIISLTRIFTSLSLIPFFGIWGAVLSAFFHRSITAIAVHYLIKKRYPILES